MCIMTSLMGCRRINNRCRMLGSQCSGRAYPQKNLRPRSLTAIKLTAADFAGVQTVHMGTILAPILTVGRKAGEVGVMRAPR